MLAICSAQTFCYRGPFATHTWYFKSTCHDLSKLAAQLDVTGSLIRPGNATAILEPIGGGLQMP